jgi:signal transduction histidine kinase
MDKQYAVLYIDDDYENLTGFELSFSDHFRILTADNTEAAYKYLIDESVGVVLVDYKMPREDGVSFVRRVRDEFPDIIFVMISAWAEIDVVLDAINTNSFYGFIQKPWNHNELRITLSNAYNLFLSRVENKRLNSLLIIKNAELEEAIEREREANRVKNVFIQNISHEIRTPLNSIIGFSNLIKGSTSDQTVQKYSDFVIQGGFQLLKTIQNMLEVSLIFCNQIQVNKSHFNLKPLVNDTIEDNFHLMDGKLITVNNKIGDNIKMHSDKVLIQRIIDVLISNALKFTRYGEIQISCSGNSDKGGVLFEVKDTGIGIPQDKISQVFEPFRQSDESSTREFNGNGTGLFIAQCYAKYLGGEIRVQSEVGKGSTFFFSTI